MRKLELLSPAANKEVARQAILHGADAVYIGATSHGARHKASNSLEDIEWIVKFAHQYRVKVYVTVNTLVYENEIESVEKLVWNLYQIGVDALIVQDMSLLRMNLPPIQLHASTQCDTRTVEKARFLENVGFSQLVLARELSLEEIREICKNVSVPVECFIHGALCVSYSGRCQASEVCLGRSANRGECGQMCRMPYTLKNGKGDVIMQNRFLLSLADFNASKHIGELIEAGVSSFKIEGRLKDADYVKNVTAAYRKIIDSYIASHPEQYCRSSFGESKVKFIPTLEKSFNRGFTDYFLNGRGSQKMASLITPKALGEKINNIYELHNGDGISYFNKISGKYEGLKVNKIENGLIKSLKSVKIPKGAEIRRTFDIEWQKKLAGETAERRIKVDISIDETGINAHDERGVKVRIPLDVEKFPAQKPMDVKRIFEKLGGTLYYLGDFKNQLSPSTFIPASVLTILRRKLIEHLNQANNTVYPFEYRRREDIDAQFPVERLSSQDNVANSLAEKFYRQHGVKQMEKAVEVDKVSKKKENSREVMRTRYCLRRELGCCKKAPENKKLFGQLKEPLTITTGPNTFLLDFDCKNCEMRVLYHK